MPCREARRTILSRRIDRPITDKDMYRPVNAHILRSQPVASQHFGGTRLCATLHTTHDMCRGRARKPLGGSNAAQSRQRARCFGACGRALLAPTLSAPELIAASHFRVDVASTSITRDIEIECARHRPRRDGMEPGSIAVAGATRTYCARNSLQVNLSPERRGVLSYQPACVEPCRVVGRHASARSPVLASRRRRPALLCGGKPGTIRVQRLDRAAPRRDQSWERERSPVQRAYIALADRCRSTQRRHAERSLLTSSRGALRGSIARRRAGEHASRLPTHELVAPMANRTKARVVKMRHDKQMVRLSDSIGSESVLDSHVSARAPDRGRGTRSSDSRRPLIRSSPMRQAQPISRENSSEH